MPRPMADHWRAAGRRPLARRSWLQPHWVIARVPTLALVLLLAASDRSFPWPTGLCAPQAAARKASLELASGLRARLLHAGLHRGELRGWPGVRKAGEDDAPALDTDWRDFRAKLVERELKEKTGEEGEAEGPAEQGWAYATPLIEQGSLLLSAPGDHFAINQQYFHKTVIFIAEHTSDFTRGIILNRPTAFNTGDMGSFNLSPELELPTEFLNGTDKWNVWCGGDCQGLSAREDRDRTGGAVYYCLHTLERLADQSSQIIRGVFMIDLGVAQRLVGSGDADKDDFLLVVGYCGWAPGQLQGELDRGDTWTMAAADRGALLGRLREAQASLTVRVEAALTSGGDGLTAADVGDGIAEWEQLYRALGPEFSARLGEDGGGSDHTDEMLRRWINRCLIPPRLQAEPEFPSSPDALNAVGSEVQLQSGAVIRGSPTAWLLGKPAERPVVNQAFARAPPGQYLHKGVLLLLRDYSSSDGEPALMVLLNGPKVGEVQKSSSSAYDVYFGGPHGVGGSAGIYEMKGPTPYRFQGMVLLGSNVLEELLGLGALEVADGVELDDVLKVPAQERWEAAGGRIDTLRDASLSALADEQRRKWYKTFLDLDLSSDA